VVVPNGVAAFSTAHKSSIELAYVLFDTVILFDIIYTFGLSDLEILHVQVKSRFFMNKEYGYEKKNGTVNCCNLVPAHVWARPG
jgi:hypothetical protein